MRVIKPSRLKRGDVIGLVSPASTPNDMQKLDNGIRYLEKNGYRVKLGENVGKSNGYLAGSDQERANDINTMFKDKSVKAIFCIRGGYGASRILDKLDYKIIKNNPKIFVGYSDITALQIAFLQKTGLITFAGPMVATDFSSEISHYTEEYFWEIITSKKKLGRIEQSDKSKMPGISKGNAYGRIIGGNISVLSALIGTEYFPDLKNRILIFEDIDEPPYKIDRILNQFRLLKVFKLLNGIVLGRFVDCFEHDTSKKTLTLGEVMEFYLKDLNIPVLYSFPHGHIKDMITVPYGINIKMNATKGFVEFTESAVK